MTLEHFLATVFADNVASSTDGLPKRKKIGIPHVCFHDKNKMLVPVDFQRSTEQKKIERSHTHCRIFESRGAPTTLNKEKKTRYKKKHVTFSFRTEIPTLRFDFFSLSPSGPPIRALPQLLAKGVGHRDVCIYHSTQKPVKSFFGTATPTWG